MDPIVDGTSALDRFANHLGRAAFSTDDFSYGIRLRRRANALRHRYVGLNRRLLHYLALDIDYEGAALAWEDSNLPRPTLTIINPANAYAHLLWELAIPVAATDTARLRPLRYLAAVEQAYTVRTEADPGYSGLLTKNPLHPDWQVLSSDTAVYTLGDLAEWVTPDELKRRVVPTEVSGLGRNCALFDRTRFWAYANARYAPDLDTWHLQVYTFTAANNDFAVPLPVSEIRSIAKSVANWTWPRRFSFRMKNRGALGLPEIPLMEAGKRTQEIKQRQQAGALYAAQQNANRTDSLVSAQPWTALGISRATWYRRNKSDNSVR